MPFETLAHNLETLHLGFDNRLISGPLTLFFSVVEQAIPEESRPKLQWTYWNGQEWAQLNAIDYTEGLTRSEILQFIGSTDLAARELFGKKSYWIRGSLIEGKFESDVQMKGVFPNTIWATQAKPIEGEILGSSKGFPSQEFMLLHSPILWQQVFVAEPNLPSEEEREIVENEEGKDAIQEIKNEAGQIEQIRIRWREVDDFYDSTADSRHYKIDRIQGWVIFGDGKRGMIPSKGTNNIIANYHFGGGKAGNVGDNEIINLKSAVPFVKSVVNPIGADGGSDSEVKEHILIRGPQTIKNRNRAVTPEDFEWLAKEASQVVVRAKCLSNINNLWQHETGWITIIIVPESKESKPYPSPTLRNTVYRYLQQRSANTIIAFKHLHIIGPKYVEVEVNVEVVPKSIDVVATAEENILERLNNFFHPLSGGPENGGWEFGRQVRISEVCALIESVEEVDYIKKLALSVDGIIKGDRIEIGADELVCSGDHKLRISLENII